MPFRKESIVEGIKDAVSGLLQPGETVQISAFAQRVRGALIMTPS
jgi:hypothetical protein